MTVEIVCSNSNHTVTNPVKREGLVINSAASQQRSVDILLSILISIYLDSYLHVGPCVFSSRCERHHVRKASVCHL